MRRRTVAGASAALLAMLLAGCGATPTERWIDSAGLFEFGVRGVLAAHDRGVVDDETLRDLDFVVEASNEALDRAYLRLPNGGDEFEIALDTVDAAIVGLAAAGGAK